MAKQTINIGAVADDGTGDPLRTAWDKTNDNFDELYAADAALGTMSAQDADSVAITGGSIAGITDLAVADGGTGASTAGDARTNLGLGSIATQAADSVAITGGTLSGLTSVSLGADVNLYRDAANTLALRNSTNAQAFNLYNTYTDASNYERLAVKFDTDVARIVTEAAGTGTVRQLSIGVGSGGGGTAHIDFPVSASNTSGTRIYSFANGRLNLCNSSNVNGQLMLGFQSSNPGIKADGATLAVRLADDSADTDISFKHSEHTGAYTVATLPTPTVGMIARVTDANSPSMGATVAGSGAAAALVWYNGTNWTVIGV